MPTVLLTTTNDSLSIPSGNIFGEGDGNISLQQENNVINNGNIFGEGDGNILLQQGNNLINSSNIFGGGDGNISLQQETNVINSGDANNTIDASKSSSGVSITADL